MLLFISLRLFRVTSTKKRVTLLNSWTSHLVDPDLLPKGSLEVTDVYLMVLTLPSLSGAESLLHLYTVEVVQFYRHLNFILYTSMPH